MFNNVENKAIIGVNNNLYGKGKRISKVLTF